MNEQLEQLLKFLLDTLQQGKEFTLEQAPQFVRELLLWEFWSWAAWAVFWTMVSLLGATYIASKGDPNCDDGPSPVLIRIISITIGLIALMVCGYHMIKVTVAPRLVLVEMMRQLISGNK